jgi:phosphoesterase RecJ-like protein
MKSAADLCSQASQVVISGHLRADGDCLGAAIVLTHALRAMGKQVTILLPDAPDPRYGFLEAQTPWELWNGELPEADLFILCDCNTLSRLGEMGEAVKNAEFPLLLLDHHPLSDDSPTWAAKIHDQTAAASGLLAVEFADFLGVPLAKESLEGAFVALMTDTGWLKYSNADARAFSVAARLVQEGVNVDACYQKVYQQVEQGRPLGIAVALQNVEYLESGKIALASVSTADLSAAHAELQDTDEIMDILRSVHSVEVVALLTERKGEPKLSLRSKSWVDVNQVARGLGGGGHARAAGATLAGKSFTEALADVRAALLCAVQAGL